MLHKFFVICFITVYCDLIGINRLGNNLHARRRYKGSSPNVRLLPKTLIENENLAISDKLTLLRLLVKSDKPTQMVKRRTGGRFSRRRQNARARSYYKGMVAN